MEIYNGNITVENLPYNIYTKSGLKLQEGVEIGLELTVINTKPLSKEYELLKSFTTNVFAFAAAKLYQLTREILDIKIKDAEEWKIEALKLFNKYYTDYFSAEYDSSIYQGKSAKQWLEIEKWAEE